MERIEYELYYLVGELKEAALPEIRAEVEKIVKEFGGEFLPAETTEKRTLAYLVRKEKCGTFVARRFTLPGRSDEPFVEEKNPKEHAIVSIDRLLRLYNDVSRFIIIRADELPELAPIVREEYMTAPRKAMRDHRSPSMRPTVSAPRPTVKPVAPAPVEAAVVAPVEVVAAPEAPVEEAPVAEAKAEAVTETVAEAPVVKAKKAKKEEAKEMSKEELDKKLDDVLAGIE